MRKKVSLTIFLILIIVQAFSQKNKTAWVDSVFHTLDLDEKIGQLMMVRVYTHSEESVENLIDQIKSHRIGGAVIMNGGPVQLLRQLNQFQQHSKVPMLFGIEATLGPGQTLDSITTFPPPLVLSSLKNDSLVYVTAGAIAAQMKLLGLHINFSPQANFDFQHAQYPGNLMQFGDNEIRVAAKANLFVQGLQQNGVLACAQHDIPLSTLPDSIINTGNRTFYPYQMLISQGVSGILTSQLPYVYLERQKTIPPEISQLFISETIRKDFGFRGLSFTDIPYLQKKVEKTQNGETEFLALQVGNDILIDPENISATIRKIKKESKKNKTLISQIDASTRKVLEAKYDAGLAHTPIILDETNLLSKLNSTQTQLFHRRIYRSSVSAIAVGDQFSIPSLENKKIASLTVGIEDSRSFTTTLSKYAQVDHFSLKIPADTSLLTTSLQQYDVVIVATLPFASSYLRSILPWLKRITEEKQRIVCHFGDPQLLSLLESFPSILYSPADREITQKTAAQMVFGALEPEGELPIAVGALWPEGTSRGLKSINRFSYGAPEEVNMNGEILKKIEVIAREAIDTHATPGCYVIVARKGKVIYDRAFGWLTYDNKKAVDDKTIYDLASLSKVSATLQCIMFLQEKGMIDVNKKASYYLPELKSTNKKDITIKDILTHQSGLFPFLLMYPQTMQGKSLLPLYYSPIRNDRYPMQVAPGLFASTNLRDSVWGWILKSKMLERTPRTPFPYRYSDLGLMILHRMIEKIVNQPMQDFLQQNLYDPLGAYTLGYLPLERFPPEQIAPTEKDTLYRKATLVGTVHDERAAMVGGIAGHAGLFGTANDIAKLGQMLLNGGSYGGVQFYKPETVARFISKQYETSRRGLGWDKPVVSDWNSPTSLFASPETFGHTGFTGTCIWVDPTFDLVYVFMSNCRYPDRSGKLITNNIRSRIQDTIYQSIFNNCQDTTP